MKKLKTTSDKPATSVRKIKSNPWWHSGGALVVLLLTAVTGVATLHFGLAATPGTGDIAIVFTDSITGAPVSNMFITLDRVNEQTGFCSGTKSISASNGQAEFLNCTVYPPGIYVISSIDGSRYGYKVDPSSQKNVGGQVTTAAGWRALSYVSVSPIDTDGDGTPDNTPGYNKDSCPTTRGPAGNNGCPIVVAPPVTTPPVTPTSTPTPSTTIQTPKPAASAVKKPTTITSKPSTATPTPPVVAATSGDTTPPSAPGDLTIDLNDTTNFLSWIDSSDNVAVVGYTVDRSTDQTQWDPVTKDKITDTFYTDQDLTAGKHYYYRVRAVDAAGNLSEGAMADIVIPKSNAKKVAVPAVKKTSSSSAVPITAGILLLLIALFTAFWLFRRHKKTSNDEYSYDVALPPTPAANATVYTPDQPAEHTSVSLRDMVVEDMHNHQNPPQPPQPPQTPQPPLPPLPPAPQP